MSGALLSQNVTTFYHCQYGELNLTTLNFKRDYKVNMPKYPTRLSFKLLQCLLEHFSNKGNEYLISNIRYFLLVKGYIYIFIDKSQRNKEIVDFIESPIGTFQNACNLFLVIYIVFKLYFTKV